MKSMEYLDSRGKRRGFGHFPALRTYARLMFLALVGYYNAVDTGLDFARGLLMD